MVKMCQSQKCLVGKTAIITGANTGIGYETALDFAKRGCRVIMACRNLEKATEAKNKIVKFTGNLEIIVKHLNLETLKSVRNFVQDFLATESRLDLLINNAGAVDLPNQMTEDGLLLEMATNYFSHFLLTNLLLDTLKKSAPSRVVNVSSYAACFVRNLNLDKLNHFNGNMPLYCKTKLCNIYFTKELAKRIEGTGVTTFSVHPGAVSTDFLRTKSNLFVCLTKPVFRTPEQGAQTQIYVSLEDDVLKHNGKHFDNCKPVKDYRAAKDVEKSKKLWEISEKMVGLVDNL